jgi:DNA-binding SARP family transcriptional activator
MADPPSGRHLSTASGQVLDRLGFAMLVTRPDGLVIEANESARQLADQAFGGWPDPATCCRFFGCRSREPLARHCLSELASRSHQPLPEMRVDLQGERPTDSVWVTAARTAASGSPVVIHLRPAEVGDRRQRTRPHWMSGPTLRIRALGKTWIQTEETTIEGQWLLQRPGQLLKYLVCQRGRPAHVDEIAEALWPRAGVAGRNSVRYFVHSLRKLLEPSREPRSPSAFIVSVQGTYALDPRVDVDLDRFEELAGAGVTAARSTAEGADALPLLEGAMDLYRGDLFEEERFSSWAFAERGRLRALALRTLNTLVEEHRRRGDSAAALDCLERFAETWPLDGDVQRSLITLYLQQGRHDESKRHYTAFRNRLLEQFGEEPDFQLTDLR